MSINALANHNVYQPTQKLTEDLIIQGIQHTGVNIKYLPRQVIKRDDVFGEDVLAKFPDAMEIEAKVKNVDAFEGAGEMFTKFAIPMIEDRITFTISVRRFGEIQTQYVENEITGGPIYLESSEDHEYGDSDILLLEDGNATDYTITNTEPKEGDLVYFPLVDKIFEIKFVEHESLFYQLGQLYVYDLICELFSYSMEDFDTGEAAIDDIEDMYDIGTSNTSILLEDGGYVVLEDGDGFITLESFRVSSGDAAANNYVFIEETANGLIDWSDSSPFAQLDRGRW